MKLFDWENFPFSTRRTDWNFLFLHLSISHHVRGKSSETVWKFIIFVASLKCDSDKSSILCFLRLSQLVLLCSFFMKFESDCREKYKKNCLNCKNMCVTVCAAGSYALWLPKPTWAGFEWNTNFVNNEFDSRGLHENTEKKSFPFVCVKPKIEQKRRSWKRESIKHPTTCLDVWKFVQFPQFGFGSRLRTLRRIFSLVNLTFL